MEKSTLESEVQRRQAEVLNDKVFMLGVREALKSYLRGDKPISWKDLKRKYE